MHARDWLNRFQFFFTSDILYLPRSTSDLEAPTSASSSKSSSIEKFGLFLPILFEVLFMWGDIPLRIELALTLVGVKLPLLVALLLFLGWLYSDMNELCSESSTVRPLYFFFIADWSY